MTSQHEIADLARQYSETVHDLRAALAERDRLVMQFKASGIKPKLAFAQVTERIRFQTDLAVTLRAALKAITRVDA